MSALHHAIQTFFLPNITVLILGLKQYKRRNNLLFFWFW